MPARPCLPRAITHRRTLGFHCAAPRAGHYVVLASEPLLVCGVDVASPSQLRRRGGPVPVAEYLDLLGRQFTARERELVLSGESEGTSARAVTCPNTPAQAAAL